MRSVTIMSALAAVSATGGLADTDVGLHTRSAKVGLITKNSAGTNPTLAVKLQHSAPAVAGASYVVVGAVDHELREGATTKVQLAAKFTQSGARSVKSVQLMLKKGGTITAGKKLTLAVHTNNAGVPSATILGTADTVDIDTEVATGYAWVQFNFAVPVDLSDSTVYHLVLTGDYTASAANNVMWRSATVASAGNQSTHNDTSWTAVSTESHEFIVNQLNFADLTSGAFAAISGAAATHEELPISLDGPVSRHLRAHVTIGGTSNPAYYCALYLLAEGRRS